MTLVFLPQYLFQVLQLHVFFLAHCFHLAAEKRHLVKSPSKSVRCGCMTMHQIVVPLPDKHLIFQVTFAIFWHFIKVNVTPAIHVRWWGNKIQLIPPVPLCSTPVIGEPFERLLFDCVGQDWPTCSSPS